MDIGGVNIEDRVMKGTMASVPMFPKLARTKQASVICSIILMEANDISIL
jgi:hypothetical protein